MVLWLVCGGLLVVADQTSKWLVTRGLADTWFSLSNLPVRIRPLANPRPGMGLTPSPVSLLGLWIVTSLVLLLILQFGPFFHHSIAHIALGIAWGGASSNLWDYLKRGAVFDFIDLGFWPVFNLADVAICLGVPLALLNAF